MSQPQVKDGWCEGTVNDPGGFYTWPCANKAKYGAYCGIHSPQRIEERRIARGPTQFERNCAKRDKRAVHLTLLEDIVEAAKDLRKAQILGVSYMRHQIQLDNLLDEHRAQLKEEGDLG